MQSIREKCLLAASVSCLFIPAGAWATNAPSNLAATGASSSQVNLTWTDNSTDETGFTFAFDTNSGLTSPTYTYAGGVNTTSYSHTGRSAATTYFYKIKAEGNPDSAWTAVKSATTPPASLAASVVSNSQINLSWTGNAGNSNIVGYTVASATNSAFTGADYQFVSGGAGATSFNDTGLSAGTTYYYKIKAEGTSDTYDSPFTASISATTSASGPSGVPISSHFFGINAWMPYQIGSHVYNGKLETKWAEVDASGAQIMRYGGNGVDHYADPSDPSQYVTLVDSMRSKGIEPVLQVPVYGSTFSSSQAADIVYYVNVTNARAVKYWVIGNEPDLSGGGYGSGYSASQVATYFKSFASAMKAVDPTIKIIGPETAWYDTAIINGLTSCTGNSTTDANSIMGKDGSGNYYVDIVSFHTYPFDGTQTQRSQVIPELMSTGGFNDDLGALKSRLATCNSLHSRTGGNALKMAVTEANIDYSNPAGDGVSGLGAKSFIGGQFWAELMGIALQRGVDFVTFWSTIEGNELGYLSGDGTTKRPTYYHFQMMAQNFRGSSVTATDNQANVKAFGAQDVDQIAVMIMNQDTASSFNYTVRLDTGTVTGTNALKINVDAGVAVEYDGTLATESSVVLIFDASGVLKKKIEYTRSGHAASNLPPTVTTY